MVQWCIFFMFAFAFISLLNELSYLHLWEYLTAKKTAVSLLPPGSQICMKSHWKYLAFTLCKHLLRSRSNNLPISNKLSK